MWNGLDLCLKIYWRQFTPSILQGSSQIHRSERWWRSLLNSSLQGIPDMFSNVHVWRFRWPMEVSNVRNVFLEPLSNKSGRVGCLIILLKLSKSVIIHNGHEWV
ncbi:hypothetical protein AVEN_184769-1 [Araneus ventricosus]|uniref:Uncharacterized protein n=1 Tax=Araneus ventricosus TaxID=182803 RepID=A0A4Y2WTX3_ARAVE|nr:hypothetical protein AVEN_195426-1 [Araneus ventricosus]GBO40922.1 hypothetical protein AVEN_147747-1 [Araneus ventricosus]GBO40923.1 hypothetical protein AVEN_157959-1 [Araneus ventricosus]GBO40925.1 hypothetical protein AVEN_184769-1 [Araneus ventricosus]